MREDTSGCSLAGNWELILALTLQNDAAGDKALVQEKLLLHCLGAMREILLHYFLTFMDNGDDS